MDIVVKGRHTAIPEKFRNHVVGKLNKITKLDGKVISIDVELCKEHNPRMSNRSDRIEITLRTRGPVVRAEASASDPYAALDLASTRLEARLRRAADRRRVHHGSRTPTSVAAATAPLSPTPLSPTPPSGPSPTPPSGGLGQAGADENREESAVHADESGPLIVREKTHRAHPMTLDQALYEMELVGHDFYLFIDSDTSQPAVVYRRRGYDYGVIRLDV